MGEQRCRGRIAGRIPGQISRHLVTDFFCHQAGGAGLPSDDREEASVVLKAGETTRGEAPAGALDLQQRAGSGHHAAHGKVADAR